jgi:hypothetical protein
VPVFAKTASHQRGHPWLVLDDEYAHHTSVTAEDESLMRALGVFSAAAV